MRWWLHRQIICNVLILLVQVLALQIMIPHYSCNFMMHKCLSVLSCKDDFVFRLGKVECSECVYSTGATIHKVGGA